MKDWTGEVRGTGRRILFCEVDERVLHAARKLKNENLCEPVLVGDRIAYETLANEHRVRIDDIETIPVQPEEYANEYATLRQHKGVTHEQAIDFLRHPANYSCMLVRHGIGDGLVCGCTWPTADTLRPALHILRDGIASSYFIMKTTEGNFLFGDAALNIQPDKELLANIAINTAQEAEKLGIHPRIAMLSFSTLGSANHSDSKKVAEATILVAQHIHEHNLPWEVGGEFQVDTAMIPSVAQKKAPDSIIQGDANVFIFPDLDAGNIGYKLVQRFAHATAIGPFLTGFKKPVNDLSRGCSTQDIIDMAVVTAWHANK